MSKRDYFIIAYRYLCGGTKAEAIKVYKEAAPDYVQAVIESLKHGSKH